MKQTAHPASFRDPAGFVFLKDGKWHRAVSKEYFAEYELLMSSGLYETLTRAELLIRHQEAKRGRNSAEYPKILCPVQVPFISYPYEWTFSQLKDAALATLEIQRQAMEYGMSLKDATPYNIQFVEGKPCLIDTLSFEVWDETKPWVPYKQFCEQFLAPLALAAWVDHRLLAIQHGWLDGIPLDVAAAMLPWRCRFRPGLQIHLFLHAKAQSRFHKKNIKTSSAPFSGSALRGLVQSLVQTIRSLALCTKEGRWGRYYCDCIDNPDYLSQKEAFIEKALDHVQPKDVWDMGANTGRFSRLASKRGIRTLSIDGDYASMEQNYLAMRHDHDVNLFPLVIDICSPSPAIGWENQERASLIQRGPAEMLLALALIHHLAIAKNLPFEKIASFFASCGTWLIIEFVPKDDPNVQTMLSMRKDIFAEYTQKCFEDTFSSLFIIEQKEKLHGSSRILYIMKIK